MPADYDAYQCYLALKAHFERSDYDYFKFCGKVKATRAALDKRRDKYFFHKLAKKPHFAKLILANILEKKSFWIGDLLEDDAEETYLRWLKRVDHLSYNYTNELSRLDLDFSSNFQVEDGQHPKLLQLYQHREISLETLLVLDELVKFSKRWNKEISEQYIWPEIYQKMANYRPFLNLNIEKLRKITRDKFST